MQDCDNITAEEVPVAWIAAAQGWAFTVSCIGGIGNLITISTIAHQLYLGRVWRRRRYHHHYPHPTRPSVGRPVIALEGDTLLLLHLSICDFLYCVVNLPLTAYTYNYALKSPPECPSTEFCTGAALFRYVNALAEWTTLGLLTVQRCVDLGRSRGARFFRPRPTLFFILGIWVGSVLLQMFAIIDHQFGYDTATYKCDLSEAWAKIYFYTLESLLPCGLMSTGCISIIVQIWRNTRKLRAAGMSQQLANQRFKSMLKSTALLLALLFLFLACVIPICVYNVYILLTNPAEAYPDNVVPTGIAIFMFYWIQYGVNFLVYAASNANYRAAYKEFLKLVAHKISSLLMRPKKAAEDSQGSKITSMNTIPQAQHAVTSVALMPLRGVGEKVVMPMMPQRFMMPVRSQSSKQQKKHPSLQRLQSYPTDPKSRDYERRVNTYPRSDVNFWYGVMWSSDTQSTRSSVMTLDSTLNHDGETVTVS